VRHPTEIDRTRVRNGTFMATRIDVDEETPFTGAA
jgi:hypothetical protein